jgi:uncharacterized protein
MSVLTRRRALTLGLAAPLASRFAWCAAYAPGPPLWVAERGKARVFLFGQMPVRDTSRWLSSSIDRAFEVSTELWTENPDPTQAGPSKAPAPPPPTGPKLIEVASPRDLARLRAVLVREGMPPGALDGLPLAAAYPAVSELADRAVGADYMAIPERVLRTRARKAGKAVHSEWTSFEEVMRYTSDLPPKIRMQLQLEMFRKELDEAADVGAAVKQLDQWLAGDLAGLDALERHDRRAYPVASRLIGTDRNRAWVPRIQSIMDRTDRALICVGLMHLLGPTSIQGFLRAAGFQVDRV